MADVFAVLREDHEKVESMLRELASMPTASSGATKQQLEQRTKLVQELVIAESKHEAVEEEYFWPAVRERVGQGNDLAGTGVHQESEAKEVLHNLDKKSAGDEGFESLLTDFAKAGRAHIAYEQETVWPTLRAVLSEQEAVEMGEKIEKAKKLAPTRPHPDTPAKPGVLKTAGAGVGLLDRARDALHGRGKK